MTEPIKITNIVERTLWCAAYTAALTAGWIMPGHAADEAVREWKTPQCSTLI